MYNNYWRWLEIQDRLDFNLTLTDWQYSIKFYKIQHHKPPHQCYFHCHLYSLDLEVCDQKHDVFSLKKEANVQYMVHIWSLISGPSHIIINWFLIFNCVHLVPSARMLMKFTCLKWDPTASLCLTLIKLKTEINAVLETLFAVE